MVEHKLQPEDRRSQIIGESSSLAIHPVPAADQALERKLIDKGEARQYVADLLNVGRSTLYRALAD